MKRETDTTRKLALAGMMAALVLVGYFVSIKFPLMGTKAQIGFGNVFGILSGLILGPFYGGMAAGLGGFFYDLLSGWADSAVITLVTKFIMGFLAGWIACGIRGENTQPSLRRVITAAVTGSLVYCLLYLGHGYIEAILLGNSEKALTYIMGVKVAVTLVNAAIADVIAVPLYFTIRKALSGSRFSFSGGLRKAEP